MEVLSKDQIQALIQQTPTDIRRGRKSLLQEAIQSLQREGRVGELTILLGEGTTRSLALKRAETCRNHTMVTSAQPVKDEAGWKVLVTLRLGESNENTQA